MKKILLLIGFLVVLHSCQTYVAIVPSINGTARQGLKLDKPMVISFNDSRINTTNSAEVIQSLQNGLTNIYGSNVTFKPYFEATPENSVGIKINIKEIGSNFGVRTINYQTYSTQVTAASSSVSTYWGTAVSTVIVTQPVLQNNTTVQGYWVGTSYLEISLVDNFHAVKKIYEFPFVGEDIQPNTFGYKTANSTAQNSWNKVSNALLDLIDAIALKTIESK